MKFLFILFLIFLPVSANAADNVIRDFAYGPGALQKMDIYIPERLPERPEKAPVIFMVHGGGWKHGDKEMGRVVANKVARWVPAGFIVISINYPMLPETGVEEQAVNVAKALSVAQKNTTRWGEDSHKFILMGHSAGGHLISLINSDPEQAYREGAVKWLGAVSLDAAGLDLVKAMSGRHLLLYDEPFGSLSETELKNLSPYYALNGKAPPWFGVCSSRRDTSCSQSRDYIAKAKSLGLRADYITQDLSHMEINNDLGLTGDYTERVETFMASLDGQVALRLKHISDTGPKEERRKEGPLRLWFQNRR